VKENGRLSVVLSLMHCYDSEERHSRQVCKLALELFDQLHALHQLGAAERCWLQAAALLHDIGWSQAGQAHHKASLRLILQEPMPGWSDEELLIIANVARYHRKSPPRAKHRHFAKLSGRQQETVVKLASLLRLADGLDCLHDSCVQQIVCTITEQQVSLTLSIAGNAATAVDGLERKKELFEEHFKKKIMVEIRHE
jgi:exopolyphosphatase/pppGpp-phosphohydrolase